MVFGWGKKKQAQVPVEDAPKDKDISISDVPQIVTDLIQLRKSQSISEIQNLRKNTSPLIDELTNIGKMLEKDDLNVDDIDKHLAIIVVRGKKQVIDIIKKGVTTIPEISSINDVQKLDTTLNQILKKVGDVLGRQTRVIHIFAKKYAAQLKNNLEVMNKNHSEIHQILNNFEKTQSTADQINSLLDQIKTLKETRIKNEKKIQDTKENASSFDLKISSIEDSIKEIRSSENYKKYLELKKTMDNFSKQRLKIKNEIDAQFTKISRPLSRYEYASSLDKDQKSILSQLNTDPFKIFLPKNKDSIILILENVRKAVSSKSISVKDVGKTLSQITETEEALDGFLKQIEEYYKKYESMQNDLKSLKPKELVSFEQALQKNISLKDDALHRLDTAENDIKEIDAMIPQLILQIEEKLKQFSNTRYVINSS